MGFNLVNLALTIRTEDPFRLTKYLSLSGNAYAAACRSLSCRWPQRECESCSLDDTCGWHLVFGQALTTDPMALKRHQKPPLPFVFSFPACNDTSEIQKLIVVGLVVIGRAIPQLEMLLNGFSDLIASESTPVRAEIAQIACRDYHGSVQNENVAPSLMQSGSIVPENLLITSTDGLLDSRCCLGTTLDIYLMSPLRLLEAGHAAVNFKFGLFARSVMRRVSSLSFYYGESEMCCDFKELSRQVDDVVCIDEHFGYANVTNRKCSGITGYGTFLGDFSLLIPFLIIGSFVHVGKGSSFGMGCYDVLTCEGS